MSRSVSHIRRPNAETRRRSTCCVRRSPGRLASARAATLGGDSGRRLRAAFVAVSVVLGLWIGLASVGWAPPIPPGPWSHRGCSRRTGSPEDLVRPPGEPAQRPAFRRDSPSIGQRTYVRPKGHERCPLGYSLLPAKPGRRAPEGRDYKLPAVGAGLHESGLRGWMRAVARFGESQP